MAVNIKDLVVFKSPEGEPFSMDPRWHDPEVRKAWKAADEAEGQPETEDEIEEVDEPYSAWNNEDLRAELHGRNLSVEGKKADMVKRLEEDDAKAGA